MTEQRRTITDAPENSETPLDELRTWVTPTRLFFVRNHFDVPQTDPARWQLSIEGCLENPRTISLTELEGMSQRSVFATIECAGNGRSFIQPRAAGVQWGAGAIAHAEWTGVPLADVLESVGIRPEAKEIIFHGADSGPESGVSTPVGFARSLPLEKALHPDTLLALRMNGEPLEDGHGKPCRLLVPGWYGVASVKWLERIEVIDHAFDGYFQTVKYTIKQQTPRGVESVGVGTMAIKSEIVRPRLDETLDIGAQRVFGVAWAGGEDSVRRVEVSTDGGQRWHDANLIGVQAPYSWALWEYHWRVDAPGAYSILSRATSSSGETQPAEHDSLRAGYVINYARPRPVRVQPAAAVAAEPSDSDAETLLYDMNAFAEANAALPLDVEMEFSEGAGI